LQVDQTVPELGGTVGAALLEPTRIYVRPILDVLKQFPAQAVVHGLAHITGGGLRDNLERILPENCQLILRRGSWARPPVFDWLERLGNIARDELDHVFNMGIGFVLIVTPDAVDGIRQQLAAAGLRSWPIGEAGTGPRGVEYVE
jgi:phosphoribosylformylglycinamidine cyclo-ligase